MIDKFKEKILLHKIQKEAPAVEGVSIARSVNADSSYYLVKINNNGVYLYFQIALLSPIDEVAEILARYSSTPIVKFNQEVAKNNMSFAYVQTQLAYKIRYEAREYLTLNQELLNVCLRLISDNSNISEALKELDSIDTSWRQLQFDSRS